METILNRLSCSVCGSEQQILIQEMPKGCLFSHLGTHVCLHCCRKCDVFDGCSEIQVRLGTILKKKYGRRSGFLTFFGRI